eukprot:6231247-Alexandrium_andersonii.AAC.1
MLNSFLREATRRNMCALLRRFAMFGLQPALTYCDPADVFAGRRSIALLHRFAMFGLQPTLTY